MMIALFQAITGFSKDASAAWVGWLLFLFGFGLVFFGAAVLIEHGSELSAALRAYFRNRNAEHCPTCSRPIQYERRRADK